ncbi:hypothetical protein RESH_02580 [Rhodopirellula europaea SH398]|uniref:Uncharacterized protein n=1 Tax=Rhodopirellula europaea SH398 TaxID=1263868 RepID=M5S5Y8_9BACT|nr:hypothetical protein RESH_02580 [Rhodopirellula europaea SH398]
MKWHRRSLHAGAYRVDRQRKSLITQEFVPQRTTDSNEKVTGG